MDCKTSLKLFFITSNSPQLVRIEFNAGLGQAPRIGVRGLGVPGCYLPFRWTSISQSLSIFFVTVVSRMHESEFNEATLSGGQGTPASSLARFIAKRTEGWLLDIFDYDMHGNTYLAKIMSPKNYNQTLPGPFEVYYKPKFLPPANIRIMVDNCDITDKSQLIEETLKSLTNAWIPSIRNDKSIMRDYLKNFVSPQLIQLEETRAAS